MPSEPLRIVFSADPDYLHAARQELETVFPGAATERLGPDLGLLTGAGDDLDAVSGRLRSAPVVFVRHVMREVAELPAADVRRNKQAVSRAVLPLLDPPGGAVVPAAAPTGDTALETSPANGTVAGTEIALQVWASGESPLTYGNEELWHHLADEIGRTGREVVRSGATTTLGLAIGEAGVRVGLTPALPGFADWPGGRIRLRKDEAQVSRSEFKLEELLALGSVRFPVDGLAVDLGAAPGGWTRLLRREGLRVVAVDPGALDPRLAGDDGITYVPQTAAPYLARTAERFDLVVNDMRMMPRMSVEVMLAAARHLVPGGLGVMTLKLTPHHATATVAGALADLRRGYEVAFARQLYHNRNEATVVVRRPG